MRPTIKLKINKIEGLVKELASAKTIVVVSLENIPSNQLRAIRDDLGLKLRINSKNVLKRSLIKAAQGLEKLASHLSGSCALLLLDDDVFKLSIKLFGMRRPAFIKPGTIAEADITLEAGPTTFMPGEMMTKLTELGVSVSPKGGKITILKSSVVVKAGEVISRSVASLLFDLNVKPVTTGLNLIAALDGGKVFSGKELLVNVQEVMSNLLSAHAGAVNLALEANIITSFTIQLLIRKAFFNASNLAREAGVITKDNIGELMITARAKALALASTINLEVKA